MSYFEFCIILKFTTPSVTALRLYVSLFKNFTTILSPLRGFQKRVKVRRTDSMVELKITSILIAASRRHIFRIRHLIVLITYLVLMSKSSDPVIFPMSSGSITPRMLISVLSFPPTTMSNSESFPFSPERP